MCKEISKNIKENIDDLKNRFKDCSDIVEKEFYIDREQKKAAYVIYADGLVNSDMVQDYVIRPLLTRNMETLEENLDTWLIETADQKIVTEMEEAIVAILSGNTMVFLDGVAHGILISSKSFPTRGVQTPDEEVAMVGPKDSFNESLRTNTALIRRRIRDTKLKVHAMLVGSKSQTDVALMYMEDAAMPELVEKVKEQLKGIQAEQVLDSGMLEQFLEQHVNSPFPQYQLTQRPDKVASGLLEGRVAVVVDNSPEVILLPVTLNVFFQASDDYYHRWGVASFARILRYLAGLIAIGLPGLYVAIANHHPEMIPTSFLLALVSAREGVLFPVIVEVILMEVAFELLREAGIRLPGQLGGTIGIVGGLIVGQTAVEAHVVSTIVVIVVALTAIATFSAPSLGFAGAFRLLKFFLIFTSGLWGLYGFFFGFAVIFIHLFSLESYGVPYLYTSISSLKDFIIRAPLQEGGGKPREWTHKRKYKKKSRYGAYVLCGILLFAVLVVTKNEHPRSLETYDYALAMGVEPVGSGYLLHYSIADTSRAADNSGKKVPSKTKTIYAKNFREGERIWEEERGRKLNLGHLKVIFVKPHEQVLIEKMTMETKIPGSAYVVSVKDSMTKIFLVEKKLPVCLGEYMAQVIKESPRIKEPKKYTISSLTEGI